MNSSGAVSITEISPWEMKALRAVPVLADASGHEGAMRRLFPVPVAGEDAEPEDEAEWDEFVRPELEERFAANLEEFAAGLSRESGTPDRLRIEPGQVESWYLALNQARLVMSERFGIDTGDVDRTMELGIFDIVGTEVKNFQTRPDGLLVPRRARVRNFRA